MNLFSQLYAGILVIASLLGGQSFGSTIITTNLSDTIGTFRTNVNTSLTNINNDLIAEIASSVDSIAGVATGTIGVSAGAGIAVSTSTSAITITNTGVQTITAGSNITASSATGTPTISVTTTPTFSGNATFSGGFTSSATSTFTGQVVLNGTSPNVQGKIVMASGTLPVYGTLVAGNNITITTSTPAQISISSVNGITLTSSSVAEVCQVGGGSIGNLASVSSISIATSSWVKVYALVRETGATNNFLFNFLINGTSVFSGDQTITSSGAANGFIEVLIPPRETNYPRAARINLFGTGITETLLSPTADIANAAITSITIQGSGVNGSESACASNMRVYTYSTQ